MKISFISEFDSANVLTEYSYCLNKHGKKLESKSICLSPHPFLYNLKHDYDLISSNREALLDAKNWIEHSDVIIFGEERHPGSSTYKTLTEFKKILGIDLISTDKKLCIWHPGSNYRQSYNFYNNHPLRSRIYKHLYAMDLYRLSPKDKNDLPLQTYQYYNFNYNKFLENVEVKLSTKPWTILHVPSNSVVKGTSLISKCISELNIDGLKIQYKTLQGIENKKVLIEKEKSLFYIDQINEMGGYGVAAVEAFLRSNLVFCTTHNTVDAIFKLTGSYNIPIINLTQNYWEIKEIINQFISLTEAELFEKFQQIGTWIDIYYNVHNVVKFFNNLLDE
jgi:hypothetical protein